MGMILYDKENNIWEGEAINDLYKSQVTIQQNNEKIQHTPRTIPLGKKKTGHHLGPYRTLVHHPGLPPKGQPVGRRDWRTPVEKHPPQWHQPEVKPPEREPPNSCPHPNPTAT